MRWLHLLSLVLLALLTTACGARTLVLLQPDPDGRVGSVVVKNNAGSQTLTQAGTASRLAPGKAPGAPEALSAQEQEQIFGPVMRAMPAKPARFTLYFISDGAQLMPESQAQLSKVQAAASERKTHDIAVVGHADKAGDEIYNMDLSRRRAEAVRNLLVKAGLDPAIFEVTSHGSGNPLVISSNPHEPKNRRVEVTIR